MDIRAVQLLVHDTAVKKGWWDEDREFGTIIALIHTELSEAMEEYRNGHDYSEVWWNKEKPVVTDNGEIWFKPEGIAAEFADVIIRILECSEELKIPVLRAIQMKAKYNQFRPYKHGGKRN